MALFLGIAAVAILWWSLNGYAHANAAMMARTLRMIGGVSALCLAGLLGIRGRIDLALLLGSLGFWLLGWRAIKLPGFGGSSRRSQGTASRIRSALIEMELDHDTGEMDGLVLAGLHAGRKLSSFDEPDLMRLLAECRTSDPEGVRLLEAYLDRRMPKWREKAQDDEQARHQSQATSGAMTEDEAYQILGLQPGAGPEEIQKAHRTLMKKLHPDQGGSTYLAARVNQAKDFLLRPRS